MKDWKELFEKSESLNLEEFMEKLDKSLPGEEAAMPAAPLVPPALDPGRLEQEHQWRQNLDELNIKWNLSQYSLPSTRPGPLGWMLTLYKRTLEFFVRPFSNVIIFRQAHLNANITNAFNILDRRLHKIEQSFKDAEKFSRQAEDRLTHIRAAMEKSIEDQSAKVEDELITSRQEAFSRIEELKQRLDGRLEQLTSRMSKLDDVPGKLEQLRIEIYEKLPEVVEEVARRLESTETSIQALRREIVKTLRDEVERIENQMTESLVTDSMLWSDEGLSDTEGADTDSFNSI